jgi:hypothetical protein
LKKKSIYSYYNILTIIQLIIFSSCSTQGFTSFSNVSPVNVNLSQGKWIIDEPEVNIDNYYKSETIENYKKLIGKKFTTLKSIREFNNISSIRGLDNNPKILSLYKEQTGYDFIITTEIKLKKNDLPSFQIYPDTKLSKELYLRIIVYDLNINSKIFDKEYNCYNEFTGNNDIAFSPKLNKFISRSIKSVIKNFGKNYNWNSTDK